MYDSIGKPGHERSVLDDDQWVEADSPQDSRTAPMLKCQPWSEKYGASMPDRFG
jgi:hypothetical protein